MTKLAKVLRKSQTDAEKIVWQKLRSKQLNGFKFKRQQPLGRYIVDFVCFDKKLIIEIDGGQHATQKDKDLQREQWLQSEGFEVVRFWNNDIFENIEGVLETIMKKLSTPSP
jgi:very-short-patch-repair endonuclease